MIFYTFTALIKNVFMKAFLLLKKSTALTLAIFLIGFINLKAQNNIPSTPAIGSQLSITSNEMYKYYDGSTWILIPSGLPGQSLQFNNSAPVWVNNPNGITTNTITNITDTSAVCGGNISSSGGSAITARGICWSTLHNPTIVNNHTSNNIGKGSFSSNITGLSMGTTYYIRAYATNSAGTSYGTELSFTTNAPVYAIGQSHAGGIIFYIDSTGHHGMVCTTADKGIKEWGCRGTLINGTLLTIGSGQNNTNLIIAGCSTVTTAARYCNDLVENGYTDWYLPSKAELTLMYTNLHAQGLGNFGEFFYWSSSTYSNLYAWLYVFDGGYADIVDKNNTLAVRPVRAF